MKTVINNGILIDPKNRIQSKLNIEITEGKISDISHRKLTGDIEIDASGLLVSPGFIDIHMHEDKYDLEKGTFDISIFDCMVRMGVTSAVGGNCGGVNERPDLYLEGADRLGIPINIGLLVGHGLLRKEVNALDKYKSVDSESILKMKERAEFYLDSGCLGVSFGIRYIPGINQEELSTISKVAASKGKLIAAHIRDDAANVIGAALEFIDVGIQSKAGIQISHIGSMGAYGQMDELLSLIDYYKCQGLDIASDCYPYTAFSTGIGQTTYDEGFLERYSTDYSSIEIAEGKYRGQRCTEGVFKELRETAPETITIGHVMLQEEVDRALIHPNVIVASDGVMHNFQGHPRASGTYPKFLREYVRDRRLITLHEGLEKITYLPAKRFGLKDKGSIQKNYDGDIVIFNLEELEDRATFKEPSLAPEGIKWVLVNGEVAVRNGEIINRHLGKSIRR